MITQREIKTVHKASHNLVNVAVIPGEWEFLEHIENKGINEILPIAFSEYRLY
ncbi:hypothetical protein [Sphingobacterium hotanense]|uniref:hypothetical protein n=1 Tax=Sphingobacterium hotanense TaxID=649196 RepID=UPI0021A90F94|nr:hypothetical protein [Sphingobacterium hotanense]MCT1524530.1 hypothetical protein [Sphingobacterium hotanense]